MSRWKGPIDFNKYYGEKDYKKKQQSLEKIEFTSKEKDKILYDIFEYIKEKDFVTYHDFMDDISINKPDWFNYVTFDRKIKKFILEYIKSKVRSNYNHKNINT